MIRYIAHDFSAVEFESEYWQTVRPIVADRYWSGVIAPNGRHFETRLLWSENFLYVRFDAVQNEPLEINENPDTSEKTDKLWQRDVCEIFIAPDRNEQRTYFEFEVSPTREWLDLAIDSTLGERVTDWEYASGMETAARIEENRVVMAMKIPWKAFGKKPNAGDVWMGNIFRCVGKEPDRGYLAWRPTMTDVPNFHVPERFGAFLFKN